MDTWQKIGLQFKIKLNLDSSNFTLNNLLGLNKTCGTTLRIQLKFNWIFFEL